ncbi:MAG: DUF2187 family protein [Kurthia sp.]|nr:DUF2187 family protein [Candidatus Kurthia equi]
MKTAELGDIVEFHDGLRGRVEKVNENSVIVDLTIMENFRSLDMEEKTVINHKRYKLVEDPISQ